MIAYPDRSLNRITSLEKETWTSRTYRETVLHRIQNIVPYDAYCFTTVDPQTLLSTGAVTEAGIESIHNQLFLNEYAEEDHHKYADMIRTGKHAARLSEAVHERSQYSPRYDRILLPAGFGDELRTVLVSEGACWGYLTLYRRAGQPWFTEEEQQFIAAAAESMARMLRLTSLTLLDEIRSESPVEPGLMIVSHKLDLLSINMAARYWLTQMRLLEQIGPDVLPRPVRAVSSHVICRETAASPSKTCFQLPDGRYLVLQASRMQTSSGPDQVAIRLEQAMPQELLPLLAERHGLTTRERELLGFVLRSYSSKDIAAAMHISAYTVQDHLKSIFSKTGVSSRRELIWHFVSRFQLSDGSA